MLNCAISFYEDPNTKSIIPLAKIRSRKSGKIMGWIHTSEVPNISIIHTHVHVETNIQLVTNQSF